MNGTNGMNGTNAAKRTTLPSTMMDVQLTIPWLLEHALRDHGSGRIVSANDDGTRARFTYREFGARVAQLAHALREMGIGPGDRVASFAWNNHRHLELYYAVPSIGAVLHTVNIRLFPEQVCWMFRHAEDKAIFVDGSLAPGLRKAMADAPDIGARIVIMGPATAEIPGAVDYDALIAGKPETYAWPEIDERSAAILCYTSATTGDPKGVAFSHRSTYLHAIASSVRDALDISERDVVLPIVPMFHVNAWGSPFSTIMTGATLVLPGPKLDPASVIDLINEERVTISAGVPTVWLPIRDELARRDARLPTLHHLIIGGSACPPSLFDDLEARGIRVNHAWGMTEMSPIGTVSFARASLDGAPAEAVRGARLKQGIFTPLVAWKLLGEDGNPVPMDGETRGELWVRGPAVTGGYFRDENAANPAFRNGYFHTGDVCTIDELGYLSLVDRSKDLVKSGGEWISSVDLENTLMGHPAIKEAAVIGIAHPKWIERPVAIVVPREDQSIVEADVKAWLAERVAKWWVPDRVIAVNSIPRTGVGKFLKRALREEYRDLFTDN